MNSRNFAREVDSGSWEAQYGVTTGASDLSVVHAVKSIDATGKPVGYVEAIYAGTGAITLSNYNGFPAGSKITDLQASLIYYKIDATTWKKLTLTALA